MGKIYRVILTDAEREELTESGQTHDFCNSLHLMCSCVLFYAKTCFEQ